MTDFCYIQGKPTGAFLRIQEWEYFRFGDSKAIGEGSYKCLPFILLDDGRMCVPENKKDRYTKQWYKEVMKKIEETA